MNHYRKGYRAELELVKALRESGEFHTVFRSAGSRSPFDVIAIGEEGILLCQVKVGIGGYRAVLEELRRIEVPPCARKEMWVYHGANWTMLPVG